jgi:DNA-directed RNA polymerase subunit RPC12/RpoP
VWTLQVHFYICPRCGKIELEAIEPEKILLGRKGVKKCVNCGEKIPLASEECQYCGAKQPEWK